VPEVRKQESESEGGAKKIVLERERGRKKNFSESESGSEVDPNFLESVYNPGL